MREGFPQTLEGTLFEWLGERYVGKVRDSYVCGKQRVLIATDRLSAFDRVITTVPYKGQVLTQMAKFWFDKCSTIARNHVISMPDPCVMIGQQVSIVPIEVVVRGYVAGSAWRDYKAGRKVSGVELPQGLQEFDPLPEPIVTPSTKEAFGEHDQPISESEIIERGLVSAPLWDEMRETALTLFSFAAADLRDRGLLFVDTKYEFGVLNGEVILADEIHTIDSSRFWVADSYEDNLKRGAAPEMLDKEPIRRWLMDRGFRGEGPLPVVPDEYRLQLADHYAHSFKRITGSDFVPEMSPPLERLKRNLQEHLNFST